MARLKVSALMFAFFGILAANTYTPLDVASGPLDIMQSIVDAILVSWLGSTWSAFILGMSAIVVPLNVMQKKNEAAAQYNLDVTKSAMQGKVHKPAASLSQKTNGGPVFGKRF